MFKKEIEYVDFNGKERKEEFSFHLSLPEVIRLEAKIGQGIEEYSQDLIKNEDIHGLVQFLEEVILKAYGKKSDDGRTFVKNNAIRQEFENSPAYAELFEQLLVNTDLARKFGSQVADNGKQVRNVVQPSVVEE